MPEPLKTFFSATLVRRIADDVAHVAPEFPADAFAAQASDGLDGRELLDRARHIAAALATHLPPGYPDAIAILLRSLGPEHATDELVGAGMAPFLYLPHVLFVAQHGLDHFDLSMHAQVELTKRFSAEASIRHFLVRDPERTLDHMRGWVDDPNPHVRRLVSEGTRLRLPWAIRVPWLDARPERVLELLEPLRDDPAPLVRRSVANNLNDLGKVHPALLTATCAAWLRDATRERRALVEHALRSAVKRADPDALRLLGRGARPDVELVDARCDPPRVRIGGGVTVAFGLASRAPLSQDLLVDLAVHFVAVRGTSRRVFKVRRLTLAAGERVELRKHVSLAVHTTRTPRPGTHRVEALVNGVALPLTAFEVLPERGAAATGAQDGTL